MFCLQVSTYRFCIKSLINSTIFCFQVSIYNFCIQSLNKHVVLCLQVSIYWFLIQSWIKNDIFCLKVSPHRFLIMFITCVWKHWVTPAGAVAQVICHLWLLELLLLWCYLLCFVFLLLYLLLLTLLISIRCSKKWSGTRKSLTANRSSSRREACSCTSPFLVYLWSNTNSVE